MKCIQTTPSCSLFVQDFSCEVLVVPCSFFLFLFLPLLVDDREVADVVVDILRHGFSELLFMLYEIVIEIVKLRITLIEGIELLLGAVALYLETVFFEIAATFIQ